MLQWLAMDESRTSAELEAELEAERLERERLFGAQSRLYASVSTAGEAAERPAGDTFTCDACQLELLPTDALTAAWVERRARDADGAWWPAGVDLVMTGCAADRELLVEAATGRAADLAASAANTSLSGDPLITYVPAVVDWPAELPPEPAPEPTP